MTRPAEPLHLVPSDPRPASQLADVPLRDDKAEHQIRIHQIGTKLGVGCICRLRHRRDRARYFKIAEVLPAAEAKALYRQHLADVAVLAKQHATCSNCGRSRGKSEGAHGWCTACYSRWYKHGMPNAGPPPARNQAAEAAERQAEYDFLRGQGMTPSEAAARVQITARSAIWKYERRYQQGAPA